MRPFSPRCRGPWAVPARAAAVVALVLATGLGLAGCGIPSDDHARPIDRDALPPQLVAAPTTTTPLGPSALNQKATLYLVSMTGDTEKLVPISADIVNVVDPSDLPRQVIEQLIAQQPKDGGAGTDQTNAIPSTVSVISASINDGVLELDLSDLSSVELTRQRLAAAQIVFTATELPGVHAVRFSIDGQPGAVPLDDQASTAGQAISRSDYPSLLRTL
jgi:spore germination protein GerM